MHPTSRDTDTVDGSNPSPQTPSNNVKFTFVNQAEDLVSLCHRRISSKEQRHTIRSHVMQHVRQVESAQGKKRLAGREHSKRSAKPSSRRKPADSEPTGYEYSARGSTSATESTISLNSPRLDLSPSVHQLDPFDTLPTNRLPHRSSEGLLQYCFNVMLPLTFASEANQAHHRDVVLSSKISNPATFLGFLAATAAHRAIMYGRHKDLTPSDENHDDLIVDPDYVRVKHEATIAVRQIFDQRAKVDERMLEACFGLIATATVVGNFAEARVHLKILDRLTTQIELSEQTLMWLPLSNVKVSVGLLQRPVMPLLLPRRPIPDETFQKVRSRTSVEMARMGRGFVKDDQLSDALKLLLATHIDICQLCEVIALDSECWTAQDMESLREKAIELEFDLLAYPYESDVFSRNAHNEPELQPLEGLVRLASLGMLSIAPHTIMPGAGNGRALTHHQTKALEKWLRGRRSDSVQESKMICWVLFVFVQNSLKQPEEVSFTELLAPISRDLRLETWGDVESVMFEFLYIPGRQSSIWKTIWEEVLKVRVMEDGSGQKNSVLP